MPLRIDPVTTATDIDTARELLREYWNSLALPPTFQNFEAELAALPGHYSSPSGRLALARTEMDEPVGCAAFRPLARVRCEAKRLYVRPAYRGRGNGRDLLHWLISEARLAGYRELLADTLPSMSDALALYHRFGSQQTGPYGSEPTPGAVYLKLALSGTTPGLLP